MTDCVVCRGSKRIRVPIYHPFVAQMEPDMVADLEIGESSREYPCPECAVGDNVPFERLGIIKGAKDYPERLASNAEFIERLRHGMAQELVRGMVDRGMIRFEQGEPDARGIFQTRATVGVVAPAKVAAFEERVAARQFEVAEAVIQETQEGIANWGLYYGIQTIAKFDAVRWMQESLQKIRAKYAR